MGKLETTQIMMAAVPYFITALFPSAWWWLQNSNWNT